MTDLVDELDAALAHDDQDEVTRLAVILDADDAARHARLDAADAFLTAALWYAEHGIAVFPLQPRTKEPWPGSHGFKDATTDTATIRTWWDRCPEANIAAPTGHQFDVIDIDGPTGVAHIAAHIDALRPHTVGAVSTPRDGGLHLYLPPDPTRRNGAKLMPGVDTRATGGYILLPPSLTDDHGTGRRYTWTRPLALDAAVVGVAA